MRRRKVGQSMVEMALVLPFLVLITMGIIDSSYYVYIYSELENATRHAAERASKTPPLSVSNPNDPNDKCAQLAEMEAVDDIFLSSLNRTNIASHITFAFPNGGGRNIGDQIEATLTYTGQFLTPIGRRFFGNALNFRFTSRRTITDTDPPRGFKPDCST
ncbi:MAG: pilus assembly protein [Herpetosiphonaceae bacterium]|nr:pilus assembly protein [Herpetosiphonaceae bacterium]